jgi:hypothetical protein
VSDIFNEVDEEVRRERLQKLWARYGTLAIAVAVVVVLGVAGWRGYEWYDAKQAALAGAQFDAATDLVDAGKGAEAEAAFSKIIAEGTSGYRTLARLRLAAAVAERDPKAGVTAYDAIASDGSAGKVIQDFAGVRAGMLLVDSATLPEMVKRLEPLAQDGGAFRHSARELLALAAVKASDTAAAKKWFDMVLGDAETPQSVRSRIDMLMTLNGTTSNG